MNKIIELKTIMIQAKQPTKFLTQLPREMKQLKKPQEEREYRTAEIINPIKTAELEIENIAAPVRIRFKGLKCDSTSIILRREVSRSLVYPSSFVILSISVDVAVLTMY
mmetsp:Transcript_17890/g.30448  ORF Transcript_17890/g.30448 Transcript_17890/m.30448 type:complete len:109 (+) Transcript_17890:48-374(+)